MGFTKKYDLACKVGTYQKDGDTKNRYKNVGLMMEDGDGKTFIMIDPTFNFAGVKRDDGKDMILVSMFTPKGKEEPKTTNEPPIDWAN